MDGTLILWVMVGAIFPLLFFMLGHRAKLQFRSDSFPKRSFYLWSAVLLWTFMLLYIAIFFWDGAVSFPYAFPITKEVGIAALGVLVYGFYQWRSLQSVSKEEATEIPERLGAAYELLPQNRNEWNAYLLMAISAGIVEEFLFRGFLFLSLMQLFPWMGALALANVPPALAYAYVGWNNALSVYILGLVFTLLFYLTGNIWLSVLLHIVLEWSRGKMAIAGRRIPDRGLQTADR